jgi:uroporphyrinogen-III synthase
MTLALAKLRVWITRPGAAARRSAESFEALGASCTVAPVLRLEAAALDPGQRRSLGEFLVEGRIVLTSANAARYFVESLGGDAHLLAAARRCPVSAVGEATARAASALGLRVEHLSSVALGLELAKEIGAEGETRRVILPGSDLRRPEAEAQLRSDGLEVLALTVYRTVVVDRLDDGVRDALLSGSLDAVALYSPSAAQAVLKLGSDAGIAPEKLPAFLALGPTTAAECAALGHPSVVQPESPGEAELVQAVVDWWQRQDASR